MKSVLTIILLLNVLYAKEITIAVAANVSYAIEPLIEAYNHKYTHTKVNVVLGSSGKLAAQISHGAPYDLFMSANMKYPQKLYALGLTKSKPVIYAQGALALLSTKRYDLSRGISLLPDTNISKIAIANPKTAPYGVAAAEALEHAKLYEVLKPKFVYGESISQTVIYATRAADIGIVAKSSLFSPMMNAYTEGVHWIDIPTSLYKPIDQGMVLLESTVEVQTFYDFMLSSDAKEILKSFGYTLP
jgi:molybdate transport system substrate-binding protein